MMEQVSMLAKALFDSKISKVNTSMGQFQLRSKTVPSNTGRRKATSVTKDAEVNNLAFLFANTENIKAVYEKQSDAEVLLLERKGTGAQGGDWKAFVTMSHSNNILSYVTSSDETRDGQCVGVCLGVLLIASAESNGKMAEKFQTTLSVLEAGLPNQAIGEIFDACYCESVAANIGFSYKRDPDMVKTAFDRGASMSEIVVNNPVHRILWPNGLPPIDFAAVQSVDTDKDEADEIDEFFEECLNGRYRLFEHEFEEGESYRIPPLERLKEYAPTKEFVLLCRNVFAAMCEACGRRNAMGEKGAMKAKAKEMTMVPNYLLFGPPGCGKSEMPRAIAAALGLPVYQFTCSGGFEENDFFLKPVFDDNGTVKMMPTTFMQGFINGGVVTADEYNFVKPEFQALLNGALVPPYILGNGEKAVERNAKCMIFATINPGAEGTKEGNTAMYNRFGIHVKFSAPSDDVLYRMVSAKLSYIPAKESGTIKTVIKEYRSLVNAIHALGDGYYQLEDMLSFRNIYSCLNGYYKVGYSLATAIDLALVSAVQDYAAQIRCEEDLMDTVLNPARDRLEKYQKTRYKAA